MPGTITLNFAGGADDIPTFSLADLRACAENRDNEFFRRHFAGKVVLIGTGARRRRPQDHLQALCDRARKHANRALRLAGAAGRQQIHPRFDPRRIHSRHCGKQPDPRRCADEFGRIGTGAAAFTTAGLAALAALTLGPAAAALALVAIAAAWIAGATLAFRDALALPLIEPLVAALATLGTTIGYRFVVADRDKRLLRQSFALYLTPARDREDDGIEQAAGARRRDAPCDRLLLRYR